MCVCVCVCVFIYFLTKFQPSNLPTTNFICIFFKKRPNHFFVFFLSGSEITFDSCIKIYQYLNSLSFPLIFYVKANKLLKPK